MKNRPKRMPVVAVVIPTYNSGHLLKKALSSLVDQTFQNWEAIVIDNESVDQTQAIISSFNDTRIRSYFIQNEGIIAASRNLGISKSKSTYVAFLDSDDVWSPQKLQKSIDVISEGFDLLCHAEEWFYVNGNKKIINYGPESRADYKSLLYFGNRLSTSAVLVRRSRLIEVGGFSNDPAYITAEDYDLWLRIASATSKFVFISDVLGCYRIHSNGSSRAISRHRRAEYSVVRDHHLQFEEKSRVLFCLRIIKILLGYLKDIFMHKIVAKLV